MKDKIANAFLQIWERERYEDISVKTVCEAVPVSRTAFYNHFAGKEDVLVYLCTRDFETKCLPIFRFHLKEVGTKCFFSYIRENRSFYEKLYRIDNGILLNQCLKAAYYVGFERRKEYSTAVTKRSRTFHPEVFYEYSCSGIAGVIIGWIRNGMTVPEEHMARDLYIMMAEPLSVVRDYYV
ncbi:MAG: TetR/AcrR family transcriptional regulator C-terminal domain-containing protein [Mogibacterium sp.]|nr:TetR/AcrR family transcriptional regulator C-terminal domain-containing protein [Mogibacterium sp.]